MGGRRLTWWQQHQWRPSCTRAGSNANAASEGPREQGAATSDAATGLHEQPLVDSSRSRPRASCVSGHAKAGMRSCCIGCMIVLYIHAHSCTAHSAHMAFSRQHRLSRSISPLLKAGVRSFPSQICVQEFSCCGSWLQAIGRLEAAGEPIDADCAQGNFTCRNWSHGVSFDRQIPLRFPIRTNHP
eukprot:SAG25_NODE_71_length_17290_cov_41.467861_6_plen_185_part_00